MQRSAIESIEAIPFALPVRRDFRWNGLRGQLGRFVLVRIRTADGLVGYGEATPLPDWGGDHGRRGGETLATVASMVRDVLAPALLGLPAGDLTRATARMRAALRGHGYAKCAVEIALYDLLGKRLGVPIHQLLGGQVRERVAVAHMIGLMPVQDAVEEAVEAAADGIRAFQIKGGEDPARDVELVSLLRRELGAGIVLRLDANQGYRTAKPALAVLARLGEAGLNYIEQPVEGLEEMRTVTGATPVPVIADETCWDGHDALEVTRARGADCLSIYLAKAGGFSGARTVAAIAELASMPCDVNGSIESAVGNAANLQFALAMPSVTLASVIPISAPAGAHPHRTGARYFEDDLLAAPMAVDSADLMAPSGPGLGIEVDERKLERFRLR